MTQDQGRKLNISDIPNPVHILPSLPVILDRHRTNGKNIDISDIPDPVHILSSLPVILDRDIGQTEIT